MKRKIKIHIILLYKSIHKKFYYILYNLKQKSIIYNIKIKRYKEAKEGRKENDIFWNNEKKFYKNIMQQRK